MSCHNAYMFTDIDMLEEFAHLSLPVGGNLTFSLLPNASSNGTK